MHFNCVSEVRNKAVMLSAFDLNGKFSKNLD